MTKMNDKELLEALGVESKAKKKAKLSPREERIIAGFEEIEAFIEDHSQLPEHGENKDIFERLYATRLDKLKSLPEFKELLSGIDKKDLLKATSTLEVNTANDLDDDALLSQLGVANDENDITNLKHVKTRAEKRAVQEIGQRKSCEDFEKFKLLFIQIQEDLKLGIRQTPKFKDNAQIQLGEFFILEGQKAYVAAMGGEFINDYDRPDRRLRVIYDNGTESDILLRSLQRALNKDEAGRRVTNPDAGPLFSGQEESDDLESGTIYVLRSKSEHPDIKKSYKILHKIGVTGGSLEKRIANAVNDPTFLMAEVEIIATYKLSNINRTKLEKVIHKFFEEVRLDIEITDRFGKPITPREWFLVPLFIIDEAVEKITEGTIVDFVYDATLGKILLRK